MVETKSIDNIDNHRKNKAKAATKIAKPFLKWVGGKTQLISQIQDFYPRECLKQGKINKYFELFLGGGAVFFDIIQKYKIGQAYLSDINQDLILTYRVIQQQPEQLINSLSELEEKYLSLPQEARKKFFYQSRERYNSIRKTNNYQQDSQDTITIATLTILLNKTCFNGLYRTNKKGEFNVPAGLYKNPKICDVDNLLRVSQLLQPAIIKQGNYNIFERELDRDSFVYIDPPYRPISKTSNFTSYSQFEFSDRQQIELSQYYQHLDRTYGCKLMLSNSEPQNIDSSDTFFEDLYQNYNINRVYANRMVNSNAAKRGKIAELLITNY